MIRSSSLLFLTALALVAMACDPAVVPPSPTATGRSSATPGPTATPILPSPTVTAAPTAPSSDPPVEATWFTLEQPGGAPAARSDATWTVDPNSALAYLFGGTDGSTTFGDLWMYELSADRWTERPGSGATPALRSGQAAAWVDGLGLVIVGGQNADGTALDDTWRYDPGASVWTLVRATMRPPARTASCLAAGPDGRLWLTGGRGLDGQPLADTWAFDPTRETWQDVNPSGPLPPARDGHACWWTDDERLIVYGGTSQAGVPGDVWALSDPGTPDAAWSAVEGPPLPARVDAADTLRQGRFIAVGGRGPDGAALGDLVVFDGATLAPTVVGPADGGPSPRWGAVLVDDPAAERLLMFGGAAAAGASDELWGLRLP